jgi:hypothetical protein
MSNLNAIRRARDSAVGSWGAERRPDKLTSLKPALLSAPLRSSDHIRLLLLYPPEQLEGAGNCFSQQDQAEVRCKVFQGRLRDLSHPGRPMYAALSYCWGSSVKSRTIFCNNIPVEITENLFHAMKWVRLSTRPRFIWIDSLCIAQDNIKEKSQQVSRMGSIFSQAHVISYIGGNKDPILAQTCFAVVRRLAAIAEYLSDEKYTRDDLVRLPPLLYDVNRPPTTPDWQSVPWDKLVNLLHENYFNRLWVFQEIALARSHTCQWGLYLCSIHQLSEAGRMIFLGQYETIPSTTLSGCHVDYASEGHSNVQVMARDPFIFDQWTYPGSSDLKLVTECAGFGCKDPRDRIYGLSSLFQGDVGYHIDYSSNVAEVFTKFTLHLLSMRVSGFPIPGLFDNDAARRSAYRDPDEYAQEVGWTWSSSSLPSWCPDYGLGGQKGYHELQSPFTRVYSDLGLNGHITPEILSIPGNLLSVRGIECATITACSDQKRSEKNSTEFLLKAGQLALRLRDQLTPSEICVGFLDALRNGEPFMDSDYEYEKHPCKAMPRLRRYHTTLRLLGPYYFERFVPCMLTFYRDNAGELPCLTEDQIDTFIAEMNKRLEWECERPRRCFITRIDSSVGARFGCGPDGLRVGDKVFVIFGVNYPVILRQTGRERRFRYIGNSYINGLMEGEALGLGSKEEQVLLV